MTRSSKFREIDEGKILAKQVRLMKSSGVTNKFPFIAQGSGNVAVVPMSLPLPPRSSGSESSGWTTKNTCQNFEEIVLVTTTTTTTAHLTVDSFKSNRQEATSVEEQLLCREHHHIIRWWAVATSDNNENEEMKTVDTAQDETNYIPERGRRRLIRYSSSSLKEPAFLPEIASSRKSANSAPPLNGDITYSNLIISNIDDTPITPSKTITPVTKSPVPANSRTNGGN
ncbi:hypothetical protein NQ317_003658 [Molorchus minor]|uniref:Uncharacterized protein n=1 Tax=Molorchus minor TaxID=1323400 RepID=A0ABQ9IZ70_9CUCU|nr:hypothetical protein NQ317_003658 [Molorchus minor]